MGLGVDGFGVRNQGFGVTVAAVGPEGWGEKVVESLARVVDDLVDGLGFRV